MRKILPVFLALALCMLVLPAAFADAGAGRAAMS